MAGAENEIELKGFRKGKLDVVKPEGVGEKEDSTEDRMRCPAVLYQKCRQAEQAEKS